MEKADIESLDSWMGPADVKRPVGRALGADHAAINYYELDPGESFAFGYHTHADQEEVFYVLDGEATFETGDPDGETEEVTVAAGELVRFGPGEWQQGWNRGDERVRALAVGAPQDSGETTILRECESCGERTEQRVEATEEGDELVTLCVECDAISGRFD
ncbi:cupin domain-containing protein [Halorarius halobius]|uniref:cupin domain-containing protein n=1 Tax=Halorarius halobius TaxID=2962671 RepID=UPI0020CB785F|nr:cupin domain-containing protein [Halorarius halobius]